MRLEYIPITLGIIVALLGIALLWDALGPQTIGPVRDRRRRARTTVNLAGEAGAAIGLLLLGVALIGRAWRYETPLMLLGTVCVLWATLKNRKYFRELFVFRGAARRKNENVRAKSGKMRIR